MQYDNTKAEEIAMDAIKKLGITGKRDIDEALQTGRIAFWSGDDVLEAIKKDYQTLNSDRNFIRDVDPPRDFRHDTGEIELEFEKSSDKVEMFDAI